MPHFRRISRSALRYALPWVPQWATDPPMEITPLVGSSRKLMHRRKVLLPDPEGPMRTTTSPFCTSMETPRRTWLRPKLLRRSVTLTSAVGGATVVPASDIASTSSISVTITLQFLLKAVLPEVEEDRQDPVHHCCHKQRRQVVVVPTPDQLRSFEHFGNRDGRYERGVLDERDAVVPQGRDHDLQCLRQHDPQLRLPSRHAHGPCRFALSSWHRLNTGAERFGNESPVIVRR